MIARSSSACWSRLPRHCAAKPASSSFFSGAAGGGARFQKRIVRRTKLLLGEMDQRPIVTERSEEHTSELQSLMRNSYAVFCLKKKKKTCSNRIRRQVYISPQRRSIHLNTQDESYARTYSTKM